METNGDLMRVMWQYLRKHSGKLRRAVIWICITGICIAVQPLIIKYIVDNGISSESLSNQKKILFVAVLCASYAIVSLLRVRSFHWGYSAMLKALESSIAELKSNLFSHVEHMGMRFHSEVSSGELHNCLNGTPMNNIINYLKTLFSAVPHQIVAMAISLVALLKYDWVMTLILLVTVILMAILNFSARKKIRTLSEKHIQVEAEVNRYLMDTLNGMEAIKIYSIENKVKGQYNETLERVKEMSIYANLTNQREGMKVELAQYYGIAVVYFIGAISCIYRGMTVGALYAFVSSMTSILGTLNSWLALGLTRSAAQAGMDSIMNIAKRELDIPNAEPGENIMQAREYARHNSQNCIEFQHVTFAYENTPIFHDFSCSLKYGESVALVGESGSGKSTFTKLLLRLYDVQFGSVCVYGNDVRKYDIHKLRTSFGVVPQNTTIFYGTIWDNVKIAHPEATDEEILRAIEMAHMNDFLDSMENGWNTMVGNGGRELSGGQRQRIGIARAVLGNPDILIFDEATSALDNISERAVQNAMEDLMKSHTVIVIAHRLSTIRNVERIMVFKNGKVIEEGTYDELDAIVDGEFHAMLHEAKE